MNSFIQLIRNAKPPVNLSAIKTSKPKPRKQSTIVREETIYIDAETHNESVTFLVTDDLEEAIRVSNLFRLIISLRFLIRCL
jgi:hypothetical protein